ncbi:C40 family peptidase [Pelagibius sp.]|uniref:C40 family peptidase n=1 Tax=Pelagibius sp. TaxID=1931238 RepID=UPI00260A11BE|nr:NlpC/P60 family protein [Pelagibius sp.]
MTESGTTLDPRIDPRLNAVRDDLADAALEGQVTAVRFAEGRPAGIARGVVDLRRTPDAGSGLDSQLLFGETVTVFDEAEGWAWVQNQTDGYVGYVESRALGAAPSPPTHRVTALRSYLFPEPNLKAPPLDCLSIGSPLCVTGREGDYAALQGGGYVYGRHIAPVAETESDFVATALRFLGTPYYWGGRSSVGLDCSTLVQLSLACAGLPVRRDSYQQEATAGEALNGLPGEIALQRGDLVFSPGHVAIMLDAGRIVHANAFTMTVAIEDLAALEGRVRAETGGGFTAVRRIPEFG